MDPKAVEEKQKYDKVWTEIPSYRECSPGEGFVSLFFDLFKEEMRAGQLVIDFGCGTGRVARDFLAKGLAVNLVDISPYCLDESIRHLFPILGGQIAFSQACLWSLPKSLAPAYWIYCCDVLEHLPTDCLDKSLEGMASRMRFGGFFSICLQEDLTGKKVGKPLHLTLKSATWWLELLARYFQPIHHAEIGEGLYLTCAVKPK